jgi:predicted transcriptional regulator
MSDSDDILIVFRPAHKGMEKFWGKLEAELLETIWGNGPMTAKRMQYFIGKRRQYAYTTITTMMNHLVKKGILFRTKEGHSFLYSPVMNRDQFLKYAAESMISGLLADFGDTVTPIISKIAIPKKKR